MRHETIKPAPDRAAVFMDRDGTLIEDTGYVSDPRAVTLVSGAAAAVRELRDAGYLLVVVSNQSGIARALITADQAKAVHRRVVELLAAAGVAIDGWYYCPHGPEERCDCRKPAPGLILRAAHELGIDRRRSYMLGDKDTDLEAGRRAGCLPIRLGAGPDRWAQAVRAIGKGQLPGR